jgi:hypothetical protein
MSQRLRQWWPALPAALVLYWGLSDFAERYPRASERTAERLGAAAPDSLLAFARRAAADTTPPAASENPFRPIHPPKAAAASQGVVHLEPPPRKYVLKGTVGSDVATIANNSGQKMIVKAGDRIESAEVVSIEPNRVVLKDRAGRFELQTEK